MLHISKVIFNKLYWQNRADRTTKYDMKKPIICKMCGGDQIYIQEIEKISWCVCPSCKFEERTKHYFNRTKK